MEKERLATKPIFDGSESVIPLADVVYIEKRNDDSKFAGSLTAILKGTTWSYEAGCHNNAAYVPKDEADAFLEAWTRYRGEVDPVVQGPGEAEARDRVDVVAFRLALEQIFQMVVADNATDADLAEMFWATRAIARGVLKEGA